MTQIASIHFFDLIFIVSLEYKIIIMVIAAKNVVTSFKKIIVFNIGLQIYK